MKTPPSPRIFLEITGIRRRSGGSSTPRSPLVIYATTVPARVSPHSETGEETRPPHEGAARAGHGTTCADKAGPGRSARRRTAAPRRRMPFSPRVMIRLPDARIASDRPITKPLRTQGPSASGIAPRRPEPAPAPPEEEPPRRIHDTPARRTLGTISAFKQRPARLQRRASRIVAREGRRSCPQPGNSATPPHTP